MVHWGQFDHAQQRLAELRREAEVHRMIREVRLQPGGRDVWHRRAAAWLGHQLVLFGALLERRYGRAQTAVQTVSLRATQEADCV